MRLNKRPEEQLQFELCHYLKGFYPDVYFFSDPSGIRATPGIRYTLQIIRSNHTHLDLTILEPSKDGRYHALIIELKADTPYKNNGELKEDKHLKDQVSTMKLLESKGFKCELCWSFNMGKDILGKFLGAPELDNSPLFNIKL